MITRFDNIYYFLSNFHPIVLWYNNLIFTSVENAYQASKSKDDRVRLAFTHISAKAAKKLGRTITMYNDFNNDRYSIMEQLIDIKFNNKYFARQLLNTKDEELIEGNNWNDKYWGRCNGEGQNNLGKILMCKREQLNLLV